MKIRCSRPSFKEHAQNGPRPALPNCEFLFCMAPRARGLCAMYFVALAALLAASIAFAAPQSTATSERLSSATQRTTPAGATFTAPGGWSIRSGGNSVVVDAPEQDSHVAIVDVHAADAASAD